MALIFALSCCFCAAVNDLVFRLYARKKRSRGAYVLIIGIIWTLSFLAVPKSLSVNWQTTIIWGVISGILSVSANIMLIEGMSHNDAGICATIYRLNLVVVVIGAFLLLDERLNITKILGIAFAVAAVLLFYLDGQQNSVRSKVKLGFYLVAFAALMRAGMGLSYKYALLNGTDRNILLVINGLFWIIGGTLYMFFKERKISSKFNIKSWNYGILSGLLICGIVLFMALALQHGEATTVLPLAQMSFLGTSGLGIVFLRERLGRKKVFGIIAGVLCIIFMSFTV
jgi:drug/metabolite transporter (DMT)-like permease